MIIKYFKETEGKFKKAVIATLMPGLLFPLTAIAKYVVLRKSSEIITPDRAFVLCYFFRGAAIMLYRTMQSDFQNIWLFISLSLLHGVSNVLSKATLNLRIKMWKTFMKCINNTCCGVRLQVRALNTPRIRRLNADLEIQNILFATYNEFRYPTLAYHTKFFNQDSHKLGFRFRIQPHFSFYSDPLL